MVGGCNGQRPVAQPEYTLSSLAVTGPPTNPDYSCNNQTLSFSQLDETVLMTIVQHSRPSPTSSPYRMCRRARNSLTCTAGNSTAPANLITPGVTTGLGLNTSFTVQLIPLPPGPAQCNIEIQDFYSGATGAAVSRGERRTLLRSYSRQPIPSSFPSAPLKHVQRTGGARDSRCKHRLDRRVYLSGSNDVRRRATAAVDLVDYRSPVKRPAT